MAATVVSVVIFLCGVLAGRGVRAERSSQTEVAELSNVADPATQAAAAPAPLLPGSDPTAAAAPPAHEDLSYFKRLEDSTASKEELKPQASPVPNGPKQSSGRRLPPPRRRERPRRRRRRQPRAGQGTCERTGESGGQGACKGACESCHRIRLRLRCRPHPPAVSRLAAGMRFRLPRSISGAKLTPSPNGFVEGLCAYVMSPAVGTADLPGAHPASSGRGAEADTIATKLEKKSSSSPGLHASVVSGALLALSFPKFGHPAFAWIALAPLLVALARPATTRRTFLLGLSTGVVYSPERSTGSPASWPSTAGCRGRSP